VTTAVDVTVTGRVQGVSFRYYARAEAQRLGVQGWVRNEPDESVSVHAEGPEDAVTALVDWCRDGPSYAHVRDVRCTPGAVTGLRSFEIRA
jgi:acylphosphatase